jgi:hypothetical protein
MWRKEEAMAFLRYIGVVKSRDRLLKPGNGEGKASLVSKQRALRRVPLGKFLGLHQLHSGEVETSLGE